MSTLREDVNLYLVPTPIGNLDDITLRAIKVLSEVDVILAEDTRTSGVLLKHHKISRPLHSFHAHNEHKVLPQIVQRLKEGTKMALITDAGTPGISDPGFLLVRECIKEEVKLESLPGATAFVPALVNSGLPSDRFVFEGFLPQKKGRQTRLKELQEEKRTMIFYESPFRLLRTLQDFGEYMGKERKVAVSRELTKLYEENARGTVEELIQHFSQKGVKGEIVIILEGKNEGKGD